jgi:hypothetical protein
MTEPRDVLKAALADMAEEAPPDDLRVTAFEKLFDLHARAVPGSSPAVVQTRTDTSPHEDFGAPDANGGATAADALRAIAARVGVERATVEEVYDLHDGSVQLIIPTGKLTNRTASAAKEIALLLAGGRQAGGTEEWTSVDVIRDACSDFKKLDSGNFAKTIKSMEDVFNFRKESERKTSVKLSRPGWEEFGGLVRRFGGEA